MKTKTYLLIICLSLFFAPAIQAQNNAKKKAVKVELSAQVVDEDGKALVGVLVSANEGVDRTVTDADGTFTLNLKANSILSFDLVGFQSLTINSGALATTNNVVTLKDNDLHGIFTEATLPYQKKQQYKTSGAVTVVNVAEELDHDYRTNVGAIAGKVSGMGGLGNIHGLGSGAITVVDGIIRDVDYLTLQEVESITVLKDAVSRMLYGAEGDKGVVMITTKRGKENKQNINFNAEYGMQHAISYPNYLGSVDYMKTYNQAAINDGGYAKYTDEIDNTINRVDPILYPDNDYYSDQWVKSLTNFSNVYGEASGGNDQVRYFMNLGWKHNEGWIQAAEKDSRDVLNMRGKVDFQVTNWLKMHTDASAVFDINRGPNIDDDLTQTFWKKANTFLPNSAPLLIPVDRIANLDSLAGVNLVQDKYLLGGTSVYQDNLLGDVSNRGTSTTMNRWLQFKVGLDIDLNKLTKGLTFTGSANYEFNNIFVETVDNSYAVYEIGGINADNQFEVIKHGLDKNTNEKSVNEKYMNFSRNLSGYAAFNYDRSFGAHDVSAVWMGYGHQKRVRDLVQEDRRFSTGLQASYMFDDRYLIEGALMFQSSKRMHPDNRWATSPTIGAAWILSNEDFMKDQSVVNYFKLRGSYGVIHNDVWGDYGNYNGYFLYQPIYQSSSVFNYNNAMNSNNSLLISSIGNNYGWQKRTEYTVGFDTYLFNNTTWIEASYFNSTTDDMLVELTNQTPATMGGAKQYGNYNSTAYSGVEVGARYAYKAGDFGLTVGANYMFTTSKILKNEEPVYDSELTKHLSRVGSKANAMYALKADGLYAAEDFKSDGTLVDGLPTPQFGTVKPGDIKYVDYNNDGVVNANDVHDLGVISGNNHNVNLHVELNYKGWSFFAQASAGFGGKGYKNSSYYWFKGNEAKYSEFALQAYDPANPNPNAECPRLTLGTGNNNYRNSSYWMYDRTQVKLETVQVGYTFMFNNNVIENLQLYLRGSNLIAGGTDIDVMQLSLGSAPQSRLFSLGLVASF